MPRRRIGFDGYIWWLDRWRGSTARAELSPGCQALYRELCEWVFTFHGRGFPGIPWTEKHREKTGFGPKLCRKLTGFDYEEWRRFWPKIKRFFDIDNGYLTNATVQEMTDYVRSRRRGARGANAAHKGALKGAHTGAHTGALKVASGTGTGKELAHDGSAEVGSSRGSEGDRASVLSESARSRPPPVLVNQPAVAQVAAEAIPGHAYGPPAESVGRDVEKEAGLLAGVWRDRINQADPRGSAVRSLAACLMDGCPSDSLMRVIQRRASEVAAEGRGDDNPPQYQAGKFFRDPTVWRQYLGDDWQDPPSSPANVASSRDELVRQILAKGGRVGSSHVSAEGIEGPRGVEGWKEVSTERLERYASDG